MSEQNRVTLKSYFETGNIPTQSNFVDVFDSVYLSGDSPTFASTTVTSGVLKVGTGTSLPSNQKLVSANGLRVDVNGAGEEVSIVGDASSQLVKIHDTRTSLGQATMYVKNDGGGGSILFQRTLIDDSVTTGGSIGLLGATLGTASEQDDMTIVGRAQDAGGDSSGSIRLYTNSNIFTAQFQQSDSFISSNNAPLWMVGRGGGSGSFSNGDLVIQPRRTASCDIIFVTTDGESLRLNDDKTAKFSDSVTVKNIRVTDAVSNSAGASTGNFLPIVVDGVTYKIELLANS